LTEGVHFSRSPYQFVESEFVDHAVKDAVYIAAEGPGWLGFRRSVYTIKAMKPPSQRVRSCVLLVVLSMGLLFGLAGCRNAPVEPLALAPERLDGWARGGDSVSVAAPWLKQFDSQDLDSLVAIALRDNYNLQQARARVREAAYGVRVAGAALWPALSFGANGSRRRTVSDAVFSTATTDTYSLSLNLNWQLDFWGALRDSQRAAQMGFAAELANYVDAEQALASQVAARYFAAVEAAQLEAMFVVRLASLRESLDIVEGGYRGGLNSALDVYLAQNSVAQEEGNLAAQKQSALEARAQLELLLSDYPAGRIETAQQLPVLGDAIPVDLPGTLLTRRPDLQSSWLSVLAANAQVAVAHKQRFPTITLTSSLSDNEASFNTNNLLDGGPLGWSLAGSLAQPLFQAGRLLANERQARQRFEQTEAVYLNAVFTAFAEVENGISQEQALGAQLAAAARAKDNAEAALELSFEQYRAGLVTYTTVLESQRRAFDAQTTQIRLAASSVQNRISLNRALGGTFDDQSDQRINALFEEVAGWARLGLGGDVDRAVEKVLEVGQ